MTPGGCDNCFTWTNARRILGRHPYPALCPDCWNAAEAAWCRCGAKLEDPAELVQRKCVDCVLDLPIAFAGSTPLDSKR